MPIRPKKSKTKKLRATAAQTIAAEAANPNKRNYFLTAALELNPNFQSTALLPNTKELLNQSSLLRLHLKFCSCSFDLNGF